MGNTNYKLLEDNIDYLYYLGDIENILDKTKNVYILKKILNQSTVKFISRRYHEEIQTKEWEQIFRVHMTNKRLAHRSFMYKFML